MPCTNTAAHTIQAETQTQYDRAVSQLDAYTAAGRQPALESRADDAANLRITFTQVSSIDLGD